MNITQLVNSRAFRRFRDIDNYQFSESQLLKACDLITELEKNEDEGEDEGVTEEEIFAILEDCKTTN